MEAHVVYCSACDREVRVVYESPPREPVIAGSVDASGLCLDYCARKCTGSLCSLFDLPPAIMLDRLRGSGPIPEA
jgi:hypothetical protein